MKYKKIIIRIVVLVVTIVCARLVADVVVGYNPFTGKYQNSEKEETIDEFGRVDSETIQGWLEENSEQDENFKSYLVGLTNDSDSILKVNVNVFDNDVDIIYTYKLVRADDSVDPCEESAKFVIEDAKNWIEENSGYAVDSLNLEYDDSDGNELYYFELQD